MPANARAGIYAPAAQAGGAGKLQITLVKSPIGQLENQKLTVKALGLRRMQQTVVRPDTPSVRGMVNTVRHLVRVETAADDAALGVVKAAKRGSGATVIRPAGQASASQEPMELEPTELEPTTPAPATHQAEGAAPGGTDATA
jgi:large subunit ribosomal protein L30